MLTLSSSLLALFGASFGCLIAIGFSCDTCKVVEYGWWSERV